MARPTILIVEPEPSEALSVRKLVVETAKFNVTTAHSNREAQDLLRKFPNMDAVVILAEMRGCDETVKLAKSIKPEILIILLSANQNYRCGDAQHHISSHDPGALVDLLRSSFGDPRQVA